MESDAAQEAEALPVISVISVDLFEVREAFREKEDS